MNDLDIVTRLRMYAEDLHSAGGFNGYASAMSLAADEIVKLREYARTIEEDLVATIDQRDALRAQLDEARAELTRWSAWGTIEVAIRNPNVASYMEHWEQRALSAEAERDALRVRVKELEIELARLQNKINPPKAHYERP